MPELPEIETIRRTLSPFLANKIISSVEIVDGRLRYPVTQADFKGISGRKIVSLDRKGKYLQLSLEDGYALLVHLGMSGRLKLEKSSADNGVKVVLSLEDKTTLYLFDHRRFGFFLYGKAEELKKRMPSGIDPVNGDFTLSGFIEKLQNRKTDIKAALMNQKLIAGIGNIYALESLFLTGIRPDRPCTQITEVEWEKLHSAVLQTLSTAIESGGTSVSDYVNADGALGYFQQKLAVYGREGENCLHCGTAIERMRQAGRSSYFCPHCQV